MAGRDVQCAALNPVGIGMDVSNVDTVLVAGRPVKHDGRLLRIDFGAFERRVYEPRNRVYR